MIMEELSNKVGEWVETWLLRPAVWIIKYALIIGIILCALSIPIAAIKYLFNL